MSKQDFGVEGGIQYDSQFNAHIGSGIKRLMTK